MQNGKEYRVLLVDDDIDFLAQMEMQLKRAGYSVITAPGQMRAEALLKQQRPDIAIIDLMMEHTDGGFALAYHIKQFDASIPVIIVSGVNSETGLSFDATTEEEKSWVKADTFLAKPIRFEQLEKEIHRLLKG